MGKGWERGWDDYCVEGVRYVLDDGLLLQENRDAT